jgi:hypothetical protein
MRARIVRIASSICPLLLAGCQYLAPNPPNLDFGEVVVGSESGRQDLRWTNVHTSAHRLDAMTVGGAFRMAENLAPQRIRSGESSRPVPIVFRPSREGAVLERAIPFGDINIPIGLDARLTGTGVLPVVPEGGSLANLKPGVPATAEIDFGDVVVGRAAYRTLSLRNTGTQDRLLTLDFVSGGNVHYSAAATATVTSRIDQVTVPAGSVHTIIVVFRPITEGSHLDFLGVYGSKVVGGGAHVRLRLTGRAHKG